MWWTPQEPVKAKRTPNAESKKGEADEGSVREEHSDENDDDDRDTDSDSVGVTVGTTSTEIDQGGVFNEPTRPEPGDGRHASPILSRESPSPDQQDSLQMPSTTTMEE